MTREPNPPPANVRKPEYHGWSWTNSKSIYLEDYFAAKAMQAYLARERDDFDQTLIARRAYRMARVMMEERDK